MVVIFVSENASSLDSTMGCAADYLLDEGPELGENHTSLPKAAAGPN